MWLAVIELLKALGEALPIIATVIGSYYVLFTDKGREKASWLIYNLTSSAFELIAKMLSDLSPSLRSTTSALSAALNEQGEPLRAELEGVFAGFVKKAFGAVTESLEKRGPVKPAEWKDIASAAMADAFSFGLSSFATSAAFEAIFPEKLNHLNGVGPMLATLAGFEEVSAASLRPLFQAGISIPASYDALSKFRPRIPGQQAALQWWARGIITDAEAKETMTVAGYPDSWMPAMFRAAYRPINARALATLLPDQPIDSDQLRAILQDNAYSPDQINFLVQQFEYASTKNLLQTYIHEAITAYQHGVMPDHELSEILDGVGWSAQAKKYVIDRAALARRVTLAQKVESQIIPLVAAGAITPEQGEQHMEAAGIQPWYADLEITLATTKATIAEAKREAAAEHKAEIARQRNLTRAAVAEYKTGRINTAALTAALVALGLEPTLVASIVAVEEAAATGKLKLTYGRLLLPADAELLKEQVAAIEQQVKDRLVTLETARQLLQAAQIPAKDRDALIARWAASLKKSPGPAELLNIASDIEH
jgi:hypothetical protein